MGVPTSAKIEYAAYRASTENVRLKIVRSAADVLADITANSLVLYGLVIVYQNT